MAEAPADFDVLNDKHAARFERLAQVTAPTLIVVGTAYGAGFYGVMNSLALPRVFGGPTPWQLGFAFVYPSLIVHVIFGISVALTSRDFVRRQVGKLNAGASHTAWTAT